MDITSIKQPVFGSWYIEEEIGSGSFGTVFKIKKEIFGKTYYSALKIIRVPQNDSEIKSVRSELGDDDSVKAYYSNFVQDFSKEIELMAELKGNKNIVGIEDQDFIENESGIGWTILIRMELLTPFIEYQTRNVMSLQDILRLGMDICSALEICEKKNIIHRDIKPDNIFVAEDGSFKLGDFGIARELEKTTGGLSKKGTYTYMAPEVYLGKPYNRNVDIYSLGIVLYKLLNRNRTPFLPPAPKPITYTDRERSISRRINGEPIPRIAAISDSLNAILQKACAFNPKDRYSSASEMKSALSACLTADVSSEKKTAAAPVLPEDKQNLTDTIGPTLIPTQQKKQPIVQETDRMSSVNVPPESKKTAKRRYSTQDKILMIICFLVFLGSLVFANWAVNTLKTDNTSTTKATNSYDKTTKARDSSDNTTTTKKADSLVIDKQHLENLIGVPIEDVQAVWPADSVEDTNYVQKYYYNDNNQRIYIKTVDGIVVNISIVFHGESSYSLFGISVDDSVSQALATIKEYGYTEDFGSSDEDDDYYYRNPDSDSKVNIDFLSDGRLWWLEIDDSY